MQYGDFWTFVQYLCADAIQNHQTSISDVTNMCIVVYVTTHPCDSFGKYYISETPRTLNKRLSEH